MNKKKSIILMVIASVTLVALVIGATYAYFQATGGQAANANVKVTTYTTDLLTFQVGNNISIYADQSNFAEGLGNQSGASFAKATLSANSKTNEATANYYVYLYIADNYFVYTQEDNTSELLLQVSDPDGVEVTSLSGLEYKTVTDGKGQTIKGFDITTKSGILTLANNHEIVAAPKTEDTWNINVVFVNLNADQNKNTGKSFNGQIIITKENYTDYTPAMVHTIQTEINDSNLTVEVNASEGTSGIDKYYFALKESNAVAMNTSKVTRLSNTLALNDLEYYESDTNSYTFTNINSNSNYEVYTYVVDNKKMTSNTYNSKISQDVILPSITNVEVTNKTQTSITVSVTVSTGTNALNKYYYSIDNGNTYVEFTDTTYTFSNLVNGTKYNIKVKVSDVDNNYSYEYSFSQTFLYSLADWIIAQYTGIQGENSLYFHNGTIKDTAGNVLDAQDYSYRYAGASEDVNNYVCFGSDDEECPYDNLYRIIGVFDNKVKLIKADFTLIETLGTDGEYADTISVSSSGYMGEFENTIKVGGFRSNYKNRNKFGEIPENLSYWKYNELNTVNLNTNYLNAIGIWTNKISEEIWFSDVVPSTDEISSTIYNNEVKNILVSETNSYKAKIGLMYISDYGFAAAPSAWTTTLYNYDVKSVFSVNWMYMGLYEWTITRHTSLNYFIYWGKAEYNPAYRWRAMGARPTFYLKPDVIRTSGDGTKTSPIRID